MRITHPFGLMVFHAGFAALALGCAASPPDPVELAEGKQAILGGCTTGTLSAPCDPDGLGGKTECDGICAVEGNTVKCLALSDVDKAKNDGKVCESTGGSPCSRTCVAGVCTAKVAVDGTACRGLTTGLTICNAQCVAGACREIEAAKRCPANKANDCTVDYCDANKATKCVSDPLPAGTTCDDGLFCTEGDKCDAVGKCLGAPRPKGFRCDDGNACSTGDSCDGAARAAGLFEVAMMAMLVRPTFAIRLPQAAAEIHQRHALAMCATPLRATRRQAARPSR